MANTTVTRRQNTLALFQACAEKALASGAAPKGREQTFAATLQISPSLWSQIQSSRPIGDRLVRQIEQHHAKPAGWLDEARESVSVAPAAQAFLDLALKAWHATDGAGRKALRVQIASRKRCEDGGQEEGGDEQQGDKHRDETAKSGHDRPLGSYANQAAQRLGTATLAKRCGCATALDG